MGWKESNVGRKRRKKVEFDLTLLEGRAKRGGIGLTPPLGARARKSAKTKQYDQLGVMSKRKANQLPLTIVSVKAMPILGGGCYDRS